jgi:hypothetical protein
MRGALGSVNQVLSQLLIFSGLFLIFLANSYHSYSSNVFENFACALIKVSFMRPQYVPKNTFMMCWGCFLP